MNGMDRDDITDYYNDADRNYDVDAPRTHAQAREALGDNE